MQDYLNAPTVLVFLGVSGLFFLVFLFLESAPSKTAGRGVLRGRGGPAGMGELALSALPRLGAPLMPADEERQTRLQQRLIHAGYYGRTALPRFLGIRAVLLVGALVVGIVIYFSDLLPTSLALLLGCVLVGLAFIGPGLWLDWDKRERQRNF